MECVLVIDRDQTAARSLGLARLERDVEVAAVDTLSEGVRVLLSRHVSLIVVDVKLLHQSPAEHATLFERVAPGVPVVVVVRPGTPQAIRARFEGRGFDVLTRPLVVEDLVEKGASGSRR